MIMPHAAGRGRIRRSLGRLARVRVRSAATRNAGRHVKGLAIKREPLVPFVVGRLGKNDRRMVVLDAQTPSPVPGPFELRAVFSR